MKRLGTVKKLMSWRKAIKIAREYFPECKPGNKKGYAFLGYVIWNETGWPCFFKDGENSFREQLQAFSQSKK